MSDRAARPNTLFDTAHVLVLSTLHQFHERVPSYGYDVLHETLVQLAPDALFAELTVNDLAARKDQSTKREYPMAIYPYLDAHPSVQAHALEPSGPEWDELIQRHRAAEAEFQNSAEFPAFNAFLHSWFDRLLASFRTPQDVNSEAVDAAVEAKHKYQDALYPRDEAERWFMWNQHFLESIVNTVRRAKPKLSVVLVGFEHSYLLRPRLAAFEDIRVLNAYSTLSKLHGTS